MLALLFAAVQAGLWPSASGAGGRSGAPLGPGLWDWIVILLTDRPLVSLGGASCSPWILVLFFPLWPLLAVGGIVLAVRARALGLRWLGVAVALAAGLPAAALALTSAGHPPDAGGARSLAVLQGFLVYMMVGGSVWLLLQPLRRVVGGPGTSGGTIVGLLLWALLTLQLLAFAFRPAELLGRLLGVETAGMQGGFRLEPGASWGGPYFVSLLVVGAATILLPARIILRGDGFLPAVRHLARALIRRPAAFVGATALLLLVKVPCWLATYVGFMAWIIVTDRTGAHILLLAAAVTAGLFGGLAVWLTGRFGLALTEPA